MQLGVCPEALTPGVSLVNAILEQEICELQDKIGCGPANPTPIMILYELGKGPQSVAQLTSALNLDPLTMSTQLKVLRERGMVAANRVGTAVQYRLTDRRLIEALDYLRTVLRDTLAHCGEAITDFGEN